MAEYVERVLITADATEYEGAVAGAAATTKEAGASMTGTLNKAGASGTASLSKMSKAWQMLGTGTGLALAAMGVAFVKFAETGVRNAIAANEALLKLTNSVQNSKTVTEDAIPGFVDLAGAIRDVTGVSKTAIVGAEQLLVQMGLTTAQVTQLTPLIVDLSVKMGVDLTTAARAVGKGVNGVTGGLSRLGVVIDKNAAKTDAYNAVLTGLSAAQGFAAEKAKEEPWILLGTQFSKLATTVGKVLLPVLQAVSTVLFRLISNIGSLGLPALIALAAILPKVASGLGSIEAALAGGAITGLGAVVEALTGLATLDPALVASGLEMLGEALNGSASGGEALQSTLDANVKLISDFTAQFPGLTTASMRYSDAISYLAGILPDVADGTTSSEEALTSINAVLAETGTGVQLTADQLDRLAKGGDTGRFAATQLAVELGAVNTGTNELSGSTQTLTDHQKEAAAAAEAHAAALQKQKEAEAALIPGLVGLISAVSSWRKAQVELRTAQKDSSTTTADLRDKQLALLQAYGDVGGKLVDYSQKLRASGATQDEAIAKLEAFGERAGLTKGQVDRLINTLGIYESKLNAINGKTVTTTVKTVFINETHGTGHPLVARGGILKAAGGMITRGPTVLVGESSTPTFAGRGAEAVIPLDGRGIGVLAKALEKAGGRRGGSTINITIPPGPFYSDRRLFAREVVKAVRDEILAQEMT